MMTLIPAGYDDFLYASVGEDETGMPLTVLSLLARQNIDPWEEAGDLSRMPGENAMQKLASMIAPLTGQSPAFADPQAIADRLLALLPRAGNGAAPISRPPAADRSPGLAKILLIALCIATFLFGQWMIAHASKNPIEAGASAPSPAAAKSLPLPPPTAEE